MEIDGSLLVMWGYREIEMLRHLCARLVGGEFKCGPVADPNDSLE